MLQTDSLLVFYWLLQWLVNHRGTPVHIYRAIFCHTQIASEFKIKENHKKLSNNNRIIFTHTHIHTHKQFEVSLYLF